MFFDLFDWLGWFALLTCIALLARFAIYSVTCLLCLLAVFDFTWADLAWLAKLSIWTKFIEKGTQPRKV